MGKVSVFIDRWRLGRLFMLGTVTASTAWGFGASPADTALAFVFGMALSCSGFFIDYAADHAADTAAGKTQNPVSAGVLSRSGAVIISIVSGLTALAAGLILHPLTLLCAAGVYALAAGLALGWLDGPLGRAFSLGGLQMFYALAGSLHNGVFHMEALLIGLFLFLAMTGGRAVGDIRDLPGDTKAGLPTLATRYGTRSALVFLWAFELPAYAVGILLSLRGFFGPAVFFSMALIALLGTVFNLVLTLRPLPRTADIINRLSLGALGGLYSLAMVFGRNY